MAEVDEPILSNLLSIQKINEANSKNFTLLFKFRPNEFFDNTELKKSFIYVS
jgi:hypothetical protein